MNNKLRDKVRPTTADDVADMESSANDVSAELSGMFFSYVEDALKQLELLLTSQHFEDRQWRSALFRLSHNLKGLGGSFGYQLLTDVAASMCSIMMSPGIEHDVSLHRLVVAHATALRAIMKCRMSDPNTAEAASLLAALRGVRLQSTPVGLREKATC